MMPISRPFAALAALVWATVAWPAQAADAPATATAEESEASRAACEAFGKMLDMPLRDLLGRMGDGSMRDAMAASDPDLPEKMRIAQGVMIESMMGIMARMKATETPEPLAGASEDEKIDAAMARMREVMPMMLDAMPGIVSAVRERTAHLSPEDAPESDDRD